MFGSSSKKEVIQDTPGPGNYEPKYSVEKPRPYEAYIQGGEGDQRHGYIPGHAAEMPGPGQYIEDGSSARQGQGRSTSGAFDRSKRETEFEKAQMNSARIPGPAEYTRVEPESKQGPSFGYKREPKTMMSPGPGEYNTNDAEGIRRPQSSNTKFG